MTPPCTSLTTPATDADVTWANAAAPAADRRITVTMAASLADLLRLNLIERPPTCLRVADRTVRSVPPPTGCLRRTTSADRLAADRTNLTHTAQTHAAAPRL